MSTTIVHLVRHGEVHNPDKILYGRLPGYHLSSRGVSQAARTARSFTGADVTHLVSSPLLRAKETAQPFSEITGLDIGTDDDLVEAGNDLQGHRIRGMKTELWKPSLWPLLTNPTLPSWGEHYTDIAERMMAAVERARQAAEGHEAICVSHQLPIVMVQRLVRCLPLAHNPALRECDLASVTSLVFHDDQISDIYYCEPAQHI
ncbi:histidine phosphatase family protein [Corynebacterium mendelii]|uniref:Histidine phosphatase family protein n=1 Tax=Corynebacterium mendelii TaxID=2765362 RepID=A0A939DZG7_9CORY|nr:histidine phosphatase family protein [Corynebacterium mendelii]MBN9643888.1 histidine phosphatase family protein [Corynebacterium mendelii]